MEPTTPKLRATLTAVVVYSLAACGGAPQPAAAEPVAATPTTAERPGSAGDHVVFFVIGKSWHHEQDSRGTVTLTDLGYFAEIFKTPNGEVSGAAMQLQREGSKPIPFVREADAGAVLHARAGKRHKDLAALDAELPNGDYAFSFTTPAGVVTDYAVTLAGPEGKTDLPAAPTITLTQDGKAAKPDAIAAGSDVLVSWSPFSTGRADPNGIADDLIFVMMADCHGERAFHSGRPLGTANPLEPERESEAVLTFSATTVTIPGAVLKPGMRYRLDVEHARLLDTDKRDGVVGMSTFAVTTHVNLTATGKLGGPACPAEKTN